MQATFQDFFAVVGDDYSNTYIYIIKQSKRVHDNDEETFIEVYLLYAM